ncbi:AGC/NDR protein kinase [Coprinopsis cinerea okayama7|uniref:non-specific serine/threonine protein kinase n=1 Tax=Coprinopsis cinerea (strain Okayama-7 / 130 / ATCC MYA-4618 / FGSC 9003) TaxID=240176 RepID=A8N678_COPC7|nr:AGC/NDR protein kinase [Coprinopsis cinerea okayama7\|eukprot:XP_001830354.2 AGC/NDR protein kinase [Coprinopsis cinerea okayama7\
MSSRPLPNPPFQYPQNYWGPVYGDSRNNHHYQDQYHNPYGYPNYAHQPPDFDEQPATSSIPVGTLLHKGFYDLLAMIPTPSPSRLIWGSPPSPNKSSDLQAGPRYEEIVPPANAAIKATPKKGRRVSKDMVSKPTGFVHLVHASDADQYEALLTRWGPDGIGKLGDPQWANPIKNRVRMLNQAKAVNEVVNACKPSQGSVYGDTTFGQLHVVNGISSATSSSLTTGAIENMSIGPYRYDGLPQRWGGGSTLRKATGGLQTHPEVYEGQDRGASPVMDLPPPPPAKPIIPSLTTLEKAVAARIYFENIYFSLFRHVPSREQRRLAMERDMAAMGLDSAQKEILRARWRQNETEYLRQTRQKLDASAFIKLKTIGHGAFGVVSLVKEKSSGNLYAMKQMRKADMLRKGQEGHVRAERDILKSASLVHSPGGAEWIVRLHYSFQDRDNLYLILEYMGGGDLLNLLIERDIFEEDFTRFYVAEMILAIEQCHKHGFIHRDIKPDNFLFDPEGHIKLNYEQQRLHLLHKYGIDLEDPNGIADGRKTKRLDPKQIELLMGGGDGKTGIFTWREKNKRKRHVTRQKILNWKQSLRFPSRPRVSPEGVNLMQQLLCEPEDRLGSQASSSVFRPDSLVVQARRSGFMPQAGSTTSVDGAHLIKVRSPLHSPSNVASRSRLVEQAHPWFKGIDWDNIHKYPAPYRPELTSPDDTRHFDSDIPPEPLAPANGAPPDATRDPMLKDKVHGEDILNVRKALAFAGFTHKSPRAIEYVRVDRAFDPMPTPRGGGHEDALRGRSPVRETRTIGKGRAISL